MRCIALLFAFACANLPLFAQWAVTKVDAARMESTEPRAMEDFLLTITLRNESDTELYVRGIRPSWYMVEAFVRPKKGKIWERQNIGVDRPLEMLPVASKCEFTVLHRESLKRVGWDMQLTFVMAESPYDATGREILISEFQIPGIPSGVKSGKEPNQALEPTATAVTDRAAHAPRQP
jgi:hypothetical protein